MIATRATVRPLQRASVPRPHKRRTFSAAVVMRQDAVLTLVVARGCWERVTSKLGDVVSDKRDDQRTLWADIGDRLIVCGQAIDETTSGEVVAVATDGRTITVRVTHGEIATTTTQVHVMAGRKAKAKQSKARRAA